MQDENIMLFSYIEEFYRTYIKNDYIHYFIPNDNHYILAYDYISLPDDYKEIIKHYKQFRMGSFDFGLFEILDCIQYGPYITIGYSYLGGGLYHSWVYYINMKYYGKRIDDSPARNSVVYMRFTDMMKDFWMNRYKYDIKNESIKYNNTSLPF